MIRSVLIALMLIAPLVQARAQPIDYAKSSVKFVSRQMNVPTEGHFRKFVGQLDWNPGNPAGSRASVEVDLASIDLGDASFDEEARSKGFFNVPSFPKATFTSTAVKDLGGGRYEAVGKLGIKGITRDVLVSFTVKDEGSVRVFDALLPLKRLEFKVGEGAWAETDILANEVAVRIRLVTARGP